MYVEHLPIQTFRKDLGNILGDIECHMTPNHVYTDSDKITWAHETTHGINALLRNKYYQAGKKINAFYVLEDSSYVIDEPDTTISIVAKSIPNDLRGRIYQLYMVNQARSWNNTPLYIFDEWTAYMNGAETRLDLGLYSRLGAVSNMMEMCCYSLFLLNQTNAEEIGKFAYRQFLHTLSIYDEDNGTPSATTYVKKMQQNEALICLIDRHLGEYVVETFKGV